jgi:hypothetical protein
MRRLHKITEYHVNVVAKMEGIHPSAALDALVAIGYDAWLAARVTHSSPKLTAELEAIQAQRRDIHMRSAKNVTASKRKVADRISTKADADAE